MSTDYQYLLPEQLEAGAILPQCLDDVYVPSEVFEVLMEDGKSYADKAVQEARHTATRVEFLRSLIYGSQIVVNRAYFVNNPFLYEFYNSPKKHDSSRESFAKLIKQRAIVPFLAAERTLADPFPFEVSAEGAEALMRLLDDVGSDCLPVRLGNTDDAARQNYARLGAEFTSFFTGRRPLTVDEEPIRDIFTAMLRELSGKPEVSEPDVRQFKNDFDRVADFIYNYRGGPVGRHAVYAEFFAWGPEGVVTGNFRPPQDTMPFHREIKKLVDLRYNTSLPDALQRYCLTPAGLPSRAALQTAYVGKGVSLLKQTTKLESLRQEFMARAQRSMSFPRITDFKLANIVEIRELETWKAFAKAQADVLSQVDPLGAVAFLPRYDKALFAFQEALHEYHSKYVRKPIQRRCTMTVRLVVRVAGFLLDLMPVDEPIKMGYSLGSEFIWELIPEHIRGVTVNLVVDVFDAQRKERNEEHSRQLQLMHDDAEYTKDELRRFLEDLQHSKELMATLHDNASQDKR